ncbi:preprotein translocase subunit SecD [Tistlia consotensis]|uniref:Protein translocase subunit SecD n=1 Tax=Tistlia consotensis USBA 355 TaxID=560819 RepID=A0A1Y6CMT0_9PROT|nr:protein translocase subunit SecD [Tistlia consotensis]SMF76952.1 preprotein translocase subunit SecD [Tistlia consotensis USBA 355]SNS13526.1 preprotein translocase subunit SecD [Tistlia consotensis]
MVQTSRWQLLAVLAVILLGIAFAAPNFVPRDKLQELPDWLPRQQVNLGLDLQGGAYLLYEVDLKSVFEEQLENLVDAIRVELREARIGYTGLAAQTADNAVVFQIRDPGQVAAARERLAPLASGATFTLDDNGAGRIRLTQKSVEERKAHVVQQAIEVIRRRIDETGTREPSIQRQGDERILIQLPGIGDPEQAKEVIGKTAKLTFRFVVDGVRPGVDPIPAGAEVLPSDDRLASGQTRQYVVRKRVMISGDNLVDAQATFQQGQPVVSFRFDSIGAQRFAQATSENVGKLFAIVLDDKVISAPVIREPILGGSGVISGNFNVKSANNLALLLRAGALPAPLKLLEERTIGPGLGADSIRAGEIASVLGMVFVVGFMGVVYGLLGMFANVALLANLVLILAALTGLQATLTLPGIAGIVLTIGMAVDTNVLIFERIREEQRLGRGPVMAIDAGYKRAMTTIIDSNLTTLIAAMLLFYFGTGPIKGFAVTLTLGLITSMFTAIMISRLLVVAWLRRRRPKELAI